MVKKKILRKGKKKSIAPAKIHVKPKSESMQKEAHHPAGKYLVIGVILVALIAFLWLFLKHSVFKIDLGRYNLKILFVKYSPTFYLTICFIILGVIILLYNIMLYVKWKRRLKHIFKEGKAKETKRKAIKKPHIKTERKISRKIIKKERKKTGVFYFILFLLSIILFFAAYFYNNMPTIALSLALMFLSLIAYRKLKGYGMPAFVQIFKKGEAPPSKKSPRLPKIELGRYETAFDALYKIVEQKGKLKMSVIAKYFGINKKKVEEWATILEEHGLLEVYYPPFGEPELRKK